MADDDTYPEDERQAIRWADAGDPAEVATALAEACDWFDTIINTKQGEFTHG